MSRPPGDDLATTLYLWAVCIGILALAVGAFLGATTP